MGFPLGTFPTQVGLHGEWLSIRPAKNKHHLQCLLIKKKTERNLSTSNSVNEAANFPRFIVIESLEEVCLAKFFPFLKDKVMMRATLKNKEKTKWKLACQGGQLEAN